MVGRVFAGVAICGLLLAGPAAAAESPAGEGQGVRLGYEVWAGGVRVLEATLEFHSSGETYDLALAGELVGPPSWVEDLSFTAEASGRFGETGPLPELYRQDTDRGPEKKPHWVQMAYADGLPTVDGDPSPEKEKGKREAVTDEQKRGTTDPLSAVVSLLLQVAARESCEGTAAIFDGRRRFDVALHDAGDGELRASRYNAYAGPVQLCDVAMTPIAGYRLNGKDRSFFPPEAQVQAAEVVEGLPALPVRFDTVTEFGVVIIHLTSIEPLE